MARAIPDVGSLASGGVRLAVRGAAIAKHIKNVNPRRFPQLIGRVRLAAQCVRDVARGRYRLPWKTAAALAGALAYFLAPIDVIPDVIPLSGFIDDAAVLGLVFGTAESDLRHYCRWRGIDPKRYFEK
jgi:uncharacterized membrane protein YkvA (DUF1232 family)